MSDIAGAVAPVADVSSNATESSTREASTSNDSNDSDDDDDFIETRFEKLNEKRRKEAEEKKKGSQPEKKAPVEKEESETPEKRVPKVDEESEKERPETKAKPEKLDSDEQEFVIDGKTVKLSKKDQQTFIQKGLAADKRFREAKAMQDQTNAFINAVKSNPFEVLGHPSLLGDKIRDLAESFVYDKLQWDGMSEQERESIENKRKLERYESEAKQKKEEQDKQEEQRYVEHFKNEYNKQVIDILKVGGIPQTAESARRALHYISQARKRGLTPKNDVIAELVREDYFGEDKSLYDNLDGDQLIKKLGPGVVDKVRQHYLNQARGGHGFHTPREQNPAKESRSVNKPKQISKDEWRERIDRIKNEE